MRIMIYAGPAPARDQLLAYAAPLVRHLASAVTLVTGGGSGNEPLLNAAAERLDLPGDLPRLLLAYEGDPADVLMTAADQHAHDLVLMGRLQPRLRRLLRGQRSKLLAQRLEPAVLRVQGRAGPVRRILMASGGDDGTLDNARWISRLAAPLGAQVTILHVISQQSLFFEGFADGSRSVEEFIAGSSTEATVLREAAALLSDAGVPTSVLGRTGSVIDVVVEEARGHDLLAIGAHRSGSPLDNFLIANLAGELLDLSPVPVLITKR